MMNLIIPLLTLLALAQSEDSPCSQKPDPGPCEGAFERWFYNETSKTCESFLYGGCDGVVPFTSLQQCQSANCDPCVLQPETGPCKARFKRFFYNNRRGKCQAFYWGGCNGVVPFATIRDCKRAECSPRMSPRPSPQPLVDRCTQLPDSGPCVRNRTKWYWDTRRQKCKSFRYGGCFGRIPFRTQRECRRAQCADSRCFMKPAPGPCPGSFRRWFYNAKRDACMSFRWGGCRGRVPFETKPECEASKCIRSRCRLRPKAGPCNEFVEKYFFSQETGRCESFMHGGCFGSIPYDNRFECQRANCEIDRCRLTPDRGPCDESITKWWYDPSVGRCTSFDWGGCDGRVPFESEEECVREGCTVNRCRLKPDAGECRAFFLKWFWNEEFSRCDRFVWRGCGGVVPFETERECRKALCGGVDFGNNGQTKN